VQSGSKLWAKADGKYMATEREWLVNIAGGFYTAAAAIVRLPVFWSHANGNGCRSWLAYDDFAEKLKMRKRPNELPVQNG
jgi:hypothetical protein